MIEILFLIGFAAVLFMTGVSIMGMVLAMLAGFAVMMVAGMIGTLLKLLPWLLVIAAIVWLLKRNRRQRKGEPEVIVRERRWARYRRR
ncbi:MULTISPECIES: envelope stress response protein PspG [Salinivibrio]|jgi:phage shock protein G|uniref:Envelope stress response protein PspG n=1 Tax=Salinivibrio costicola TaxID=51367 RepID=A0ABX6K9D7_SALCS|nr:MULTISPECIES: envelope stress response protein PspG [Salinivibrio]ODP98934.1 phage shock protein G [Salinivibrio sp. DV]OOF10763.1 phage shock protein G [Salinivibrio sp. PR5]OOF13073.1 phage shock protein G [Salinivibrio sp. PR919]OOF17267.1 phage shock protein G [Salinivibrio sp. PR932]OOF20237.1 phage shock protein G [Salinivibrio sp. IB574]